MSRILFIVLTTFLILSLPNLLLADVISGTANLSAGGLGGWDFSIMETVAVDDGDIGVAHVGDLGGYFVIGLNGALVAHLPDSTFEDLKYAPEDSTIYSMMQPAYVHSLYLMKTRDNKYVKLRFPENYSSFDFIFQPDGSRKLFDYIGTEYKSWGIIKLRNLNQ